MECDITISRIRHPCGPAFKESIVSSLVQMIGSLSRSPDAEDANWEMHSQTMSSRNSDPTPPLLIRR